MRNETAHGVKFRMRHETAHEAKFRMRNETAHEVKFRMRHENEETREKYIVNMPAGWCVLTYLLYGK